MVLVVCAPKAIQVAFSTAAFVTSIGMEHNTVASSVAAKPWLDKVGGA